jgi:inorganic pyrophosphatase
VEISEELDVVIEVPLGSFIKRRDDGRVDFVSPVPCPFNYGSVPDTLSGDGDRVDAVVLGPRLPRGRGCA